MRSEAQHWWTPADARRKMVECHQASARASGGEFACLTTSFAKKEREESILSIQLGQGAPSH